MTEIIQNGDKSIKIIVDNDEVYNGAALFFALVQGSSIELLPLNYDAGTTSRIPTFKHDEVTVNGGSVFADQDSAIAAINAVVGNFKSGNGGGGGIAIPDNYFFNSSTDVTDYFDQHPTELLVGTLINVAGQFQIWDGFAWQDATAVVQGPKGEKGETGATGPAGADGTDGIDGAPGPQGIPGADGADGATGPAGADGQDGADGRIQSIVAGENVDVDDTDPANPVVSAKNGSTEGYAYKTINLTDVKIGDDLSGATINFNPNNKPMFLNPNAGLSGFQWVVWSGTSGTGINISVAWNANSIQDGALNYIYNVPSGDLTIPNWIEDVYSFPENTIVTEMHDLGGNRQNWDDVVAGMDPSGWNPSMATVTIRVKTVNIGGEETATNIVGETIFVNGEEFDLSDYAKKSDVANAVPNVKTFVTLADFATQFADGTIKAGDIISVTDYVDEVTGETGGMAVVGVQGQLGFFALQSTLDAHIIADQKRWAQLSQQTAANTLQIQRILTGNVDVEPDTARAEEIETVSPFTVPTTDVLGGQIAGSAYTYLLFGTGHIEVDNVSVFDIRGLTVSIDKSSYAGDVNPGQVITSGGMTTLTYTPYKAKSTT